MLNPSDSGRNGQGRRPAGPAVIVVDDQRQLAEVLAERLAMDGFVATVATTAAEALSSSTYLTYDLAFVDLILPDMNGIAAAAELKRRLPRLRVYLMTGMAASLDDPLLGWNQVDGILPKPWRPAELDAILRAVGKGEG